MGGSSGGRRQLVVENGCGGLFSTSGPCGGSTLRGSGSTPPSEGGDTGGASGGGAVVEWRGEFFGNRIVTSRPASYTPPSANVSLATKCSLFVAGQFFHGTITK